MSRPQVLSLPERLDADPAATGRGVCIGFVDAGFFAHPDLLRPAGRVRAFVDAHRERARRSDFFEARPAAWHGTMTASVAAGSGYLSGGRYRGLACEASLVLLQCTNERGRVDGATVAHALRFPLRNPQYKIRVLSVSVGLDDDDPRRDDVNAAVSELTEAGVLVCVAAGNDPRAKLTAPASAADALTVGGFDDGNTQDPSDDAPWPSTRGAGERGAPKPDLLAPATCLPAPMLPGTLVAREGAALFAALATVEELTAEASYGGERPRASHARAQPTTDERTADALLRALEERLAFRKYIAPDYQHVEGTSFAAPIVASVAAQMLEVNPALTPTMLRAGLLTTARALPGVARAVQGAGVLTPRAAVHWARGRGPSG